MKIKKGWFHYIVAGAAGILLILCYFIGNGYVKELVTKIGYVMFVQENNLNGMDFDRVKAVRTQNERSEEPLFYVMLAI